MRLSRSSSSSSLPWRLAWPSRGYLGRASTVLVGAETGGTTAQSRLGSARRGHDHRRGLEKRGHPADRSPLAEALCLSGLGRPRRNSCRPVTCPHQMSAETEVRLLELREEHPGWGPRTLHHQLEKEDVFPLPRRSSIYRVLIRHGLAIPRSASGSGKTIARRERSRSMELWQMDIMGGVRLKRSRAHDHHRPR